MDKLRLVRRCGTIILFFYFDFLFRSPFIAYRKSESTTFSDKPYEYQWLWYIKESVLCFTHHHGMCAKNLTEIGIV